MQLYAPTRGLPCLTFGSVCRGKLDLGQGKIEATTLRMLTRSGEEREIQGLKL